MAALLACLASGSVAAAQAPVGIDLRILAGGGVLARTGEHVGGGGEAVRLVSSTGAICDGTLGPYAETPIENLEGESRPGIVAPVRGCRADGIFAILRPAPASSWPVSRPATDPRAATAIAAAQTAAATAGHLRGEITWDPPRVYELGGAIYALVTGPSCAGEEEYGCSPTVAAVTRVRGGAAPEVVIARPAHWLWTHEELIDCWFGWRGIADVDGDGTIELIETQFGESAFMIRLVRAGARPAGDVVWLASYRDDVLDATVGRPPRPLTAMTPSAPH